MTGNHGTVSRYTTGCRCAECTEAARLNRKAKRQAKDGRPLVVMCPTCCEWFASDAGMMSHDRRMHTKRRDD